MLLDRLFKSMLIIKEAYIIDYTLNIFQSLHIFCTEKRGKKYDTETKVLVIVFFSFSFDSEQGNKEEKCSE